MWIYKRFKKEQLNIYLDCFCKWMSVKMKYYIGNTCESLYFECK